MKRQRSEVRCRRSEDRKKSEVSRLRLMASACQGGRKSEGEKTEIRGRKSEIGRVKTESSEKGRRREREDNCEFRIADCEFERQRTEGGGKTALGAMLQHIFEKLRRSEDLYFAI